MSPFKERKQERSCIASTFESSCPKGKQHIYAKFQNLGTKNKHSNDKIWFTSLLIKKFPNGMGKLTNASRVIHILMWIQ
jgi:hypothetical protein